MYGHKLEEAKRSLHYLLDLLKPEDRISIILFDNGSDLILRPKKIGTSKQLIKNAIDSIEDKGATNIKAGLDTAFQAMIDRQTRNQVTGVLLLSDGQDNQYFKNKEAIVDAFFADCETKMLNDPFTLHTFGYGDDHDENMLDQIAKKKGGNFYYVQDIELVSDSFIDCLAGLSSVVGKNAFVDIELLPSSVFPEIRFKKTYGIMFSGNDSLKRTVALNNVTKGYSKDFIFEVILDRAQNTESLQGNITMTIANARFNVENLNRQKFVINCDLKLVIENGSADIIIETNEEVVKKSIESQRK